MKAICINDIRGIRRWKIDNTDIDETDNISNTCLGVTVKGGPNGGSTSMGG